MESPLDHTVRIYESGRSVAEVLAAMGVRAHEVRSAASAGRIRLNGRVTQPHARVREADRLELRGEGEHVGGIDPVSVPFGIVHEDDALLVIDKPPYLLVHPARPDQRHTLIHGLAHHYRATGVESRLHPVHRLDRDTSGVLLVAKNPEVHLRLAEQLRCGSLKRTYLAWVNGNVSDDDGRIEAPIGIHPTDPVLRAVRPDGDPAATRYEVVERFGTATLVRLRLETGRTHQIRVHLAHLGHPLIGDRQYGRRGLKLIGRQALHAERLDFRHPVSAEPVSFSAPIPADLQQLSDRLGG